MFGRITMMNGLEMVSGFHRTLEEAMAYALEHPGVIAIDENVHGANQKRVWTRPKDEEPDPFDIEHYEGH